MLLAAGRGRPIIGALRLTVAGWPQVWKRLIVMGFDVVALCLALTLSYALRYGVWTPPTRLDQYAVMLSGPLIAIPIFIRMGLYRAVIRYLPERAFWTIVLAITYAAVGWVLLAFVSELAAHGYVPRSVPVIYWLLGVIFVAGSRFLAKALLGPGAAAMRDRPAVLIYGAGEAGVQLATTLARERGNFIVGFLDDNGHIQGRDVAGFRVYTPSYLPTLIAQYGVSEVIITMPSLGFAQRQQIVAKISGHGVKIRTLPSLADVAQGKYLVNEIREFDIDELLGRSSVPPDRDLLREMIEGRTIMVTGAGGSIGSELCRLIVGWAPQRLVLLEANEFALYKIDRELSSLEDRAVVPVLGSVTDANVVRRAIVDHGVEVLFHAAAHKHVPLVEANALEGMRNNVLGTANVAEIALAAGVRNFVLISSDKAVRPTNVMGATKRWAELIVWQKSAEAMKSNSGQRFCSVRFGNVLGSNGSVVPLFREQIARGGPVTLTDPDMRRYFMSIHEAAELIVQASALSDGGDVFLLEMGEPILIKDLAENMIRLAGFSVRDVARPDGEVEMVVTGKRPGEKMFEELFYDEAAADTTRHPKILRSPRADSPAGNVNEALAQLRALLERQDEPAARELLFEFIQ